ncbi:ACT domain-containing protein [Deferribacter thermophilus]|uniref:glycine cleavage system protein R n=1 Tax=Deferribacter thermophilus TaxID=53573 RepID=UPI003C1E767B
MKKNFYALTFISEDRPGIVAKVSKILYENNFNIEDSSSTLLKGFFSMILIVSTDKDYKVNEIKKKFAPLVKELGMATSVRKIEKFQKLPDGKTFIISVYGADKPGIVYTVSNFLAEKHINIVDLQTKVAGSDKKPVYIMVLEVIIPESISDKNWDKELKEIAKSIGIDINIREIETYEM